MPKITSLVVEASNRWLKISLALILVLIIALTTLNYLGIIDLSKYLPFLPKKANLATEELVMPFTLDTCDIKKEGNPLVLNALPSGDGLSGQIQGLVKEVVKEPIRGSYIITLASLDDKQSYDFNILDQEDLVVDIKQKPSSMSGIKKDNQLLLFFQCSKESNLFKFNQVMIEK